MKKREMGKMLKNIAATHKAKLLEVAKKNTKSNKNGLTVIEKGDPWREDDEPKESFLDYDSTSKELVYN